MIVAPTVPSDLYLDINEAGNFIPIEIDGWDCTDCSGEPMDYVVTFSADSFMFTVTDPGSQNAYPTNPAVIIYWSSISYSIDTTI